MENEQTRRSYDPLDRETFDAIAYNAVGRASEIGTFPALHLTHSTGRSGWSVGIVQWDFGQPGRGEKVAELLAGYQANARPDDRFTEQELASLSTRLRTPGQVGNALSAEEQSRLNTYLRSDPGRDFVSALNEEQIQKKWTNVGQPLSEIEWLQELRRTDPGQATQIVAQTMKLYNQNEVRGARLIEYLRDNESTAQQTSEWIGSEGINGLTASARAAIVSGRDKAIAGARLMDSLETGDGRLSEAWRREVHTNGNASLFRNFATSPDVQLLDAMMRDPAAGRSIFSQVEGDAPNRRVSIRPYNDSAALEMGRVDVTAEGQLGIRSPNGDRFEMTPEGWNRNGIPMQGPQPGREADEPDHRQGLRPLGALSPEHERHPDREMLEQIRTGVRSLDEQAGKLYDGDSERLSRSLLAACKDDERNGAQPGPSISANALARVDHVVTGKDGRFAIAVEGDLGDPAHKLAVVDIAQAIKTPIEQSDLRLNVANERIEQERQLAMQRQESLDRDAPGLANPVVRT